MLPAQYFLSFAALFYCTNGQASTPDKFVAAVDKPSNFTGGLNNSMSSAFFKGSFLNLFDIILNGLKF